MPETCAPWSGGCGSEDHWAVTEIERAALRARSGNSWTGEHPEVDSRMLLVIGARVQRFNDIYKTKYVSTALLMVSRNIPPLRGFIGTLVIFRPTHIRQLRSQQGAKLIADRNEYIEVTLWEF